MKKFGKIYFLYLVVFLGMLSAFGPIVIDMYLPVLPEMAEVFRCETSLVQLGLTFCMVGLAVGQMLFGPASDKYGRRSVLVFTLLIFVVASILCCMSTSLSVFIAARFLQGIGGAGGIVLSRSVAADIYSGRELAKLIALLSAINNIGPVAAPVVGGAVAQAWGWRGIFVSLLSVGVLLTFMSFVLRESLDKCNRFKGSLVASMKGYATVLRVKGFGAYCLVYAFSMAALFSYISSTPFIVQTVYGFSALEFSLVFAVNALGLATGSALILKFKTIQKATLTGSLLGAAVAFIAVIVSLIGCGGFWLYEMSTIVLLFALGLALTGSTTVAMNLGRGCAGAASAVVGGIGYISGGIISPFAGVGNILVTSFSLCCLFLLSGAVLSIRSKVKDL
ncbi:MAG: multidrug effflux MFS transporter [Candidatus Limisoma sp.]